MISETLSKLLLLWVATLMGLNSYSQKSLAGSVITQELLQHYVQALSHDSMQGRYTGTIGCEKSADLIATEMRKIELKLIKNGDSNYRHPYYIAKGKDTVMAANIIGLIPGKTPEKYIIFSAHYDHVGDAGEQVIWQQLKTTIGDKIYNGANDNASGVAALLALARYFKLLQNNSYTLLFVAFSGEEGGLLGSEVFVKSFVNLGSIKQVINLEMMGRFSTKSTKPFVTEGINSSGLIKKLNTNLRRINPAAEKGFFERDKYPLEDNFIRSDNYSFAIKGVPANTIMATHDTDKFYHSPSDDWRTLDFEAMTRAVKAIAMACTPLVQDNN